MGSDATLSTASLSASCQPLPYAGDQTIDTALAFHTSRLLSVMAACCQGKSCSFKISPSRWTTSASKMPLSQQSPASVSSAPSVPSLFCRLTQFLNDKCHEHKLQAESDTEISVHN
ncbi:hypothetical protein ACOMHN_010992 [Nucella lapillus]